MNPSAQKSLFPTTLGVQNELARKLADLWEQGQPDLREFITEAGDINAEQLLALVRIDQDQRWHRGERVRVESYVDQLAPLRGNDKALLDVIFSEIELRGRRGEAPKLDEYLQRFPQFAPQLQRQFAMHNLREDRLDTTEGESTHVQPQSGTDTLSGESLTLEQQYGELQFHAKGGLGAVYRASDQQVHRDVAIKFVHERYAADSETQLRFLREAEVTGRLEHPGVVPVHGVGQSAAGRAFYVMRFIRGETLEVAIQRFHQTQPAAYLSGPSGLEFRDLLVRFMSVCNTIAYAHNRGIIHRDIKPENIMLGKYGETLVVDWGLALPVNRDERARASGEKTLMPKSGSQSGDSSEGGAGTPAYMSPEQAAGRLDIGPETDIYSLGATLYKLIAGEGAFKGRSPGEIMQAVQIGEFPPPSKIRADVPRALEAICLKAMARDPKDRYATALELAKEVERWLGDEPVQAFREPVRLKLARWIRHHRTVAQATLAATLAIIIVSIISAVWLGRLASTERKAREQGLQLSAKFAAKTVASEINLRWRILEMEALDPKLRVLLARADASPGDEAIRAELQAWVNERFIQHDKTTRAGGWFINDREGRLLVLARSANSNYPVPIGKSFAYRDYFHGQGRDLKPEEVTEDTHIREVHRSTVFKSRSDGKLKVAFSTPVWSDASPRKFLGVLAMSVDVGRFSILQTELGENRFAMLVDTKPDWIEQDERKGVILHHPRLEALQISGASSMDHPIRIDADFLKRLESLRELRMRQDALDQPPDKPVEQGRNFSADYADPLGYEGDWLAAFEPVLVKGRSNQLKDTGWVVVVQERK